MNIQQKTEIASLRSKGFGYTKIAQAPGLPKDTVKSYCKRNNLPAADLKGAADTHAVILYGMRKRDNSGTRQKKNSASMSADTSGGTHVRRNSPAKPSIPTPVRAVKNRSQSTATIIGNTAAMPAISKTGSKTVKVMNKK